MSFNIQEPLYTVVCIRQMPSVNYTSARNLTLAEANKHMLDYPLGILGKVNEDVYPHLKENRFIRFDLIQEPIETKFIDARGSIVKIGQMVLTKSLKEKEVEFIFHMSHNENYNNIKLKGLKRLVYAVDVMRSF